MMIIFLFILFYLNYCNKICLLILFQLKMFCIFFLSFQLFLSSLCLCLQLLEHFRSIINIFTTMTLSQMDSNISSPSPSTSSTPFVKSPITSSSWGLNGKVPCNWKKKCPLFTKSRHNSSKLITWIYRKRNFNSGWRMSI